MFRFSSVLICFLIALTNSATAKSAKIDRTYFVVPITESGTKTKAREGEAIFVMRYVNIQGKIHLCGGYDFATPLLFITNQPFKKGDAYQYRARQTSLRRSTHIGKFLARSHLVMSGKKIKSGLSKLGLLRAVKAREDKNAFKGTKGVSSTDSLDVTVPVPNAKAYAGQTVNCVRTKQAWSAGMEKIRPVIKMPSFIKYRVPR